MESQRTAVTEIARYALIASASLTTISRLEFKAKVDPAHYVVDRKQKATFVSLRQFLAASAAGAVFTSSQPSVPDSLVASGKERSIDDQLSSFGIVRDLLPEDADLSAFLEEASEIINEIESEPIGSMKRERQEFLRDEFRPFLKRLTHTTELSARVNGSENSSLRSTLV